MSLNPFSEIVLNTNYIVKILKNDGSTNVFLGSQVNYSKQFDVSVYMREGFQMVQTFLLTDTLRYTSEYLLTLGVRIFKPRLVFSQL